MEHDVKDIVAHPEKYGFKWGMGPVQKPQGTVLANDAPHVVHDDVALMTEHFGPSYFLDIANGGQSGKVRDQAITREALYADRKVSRDDLKTMIVQRMLGMAKARNVRTVEKHYGADGLEYATREAAIEASKKFYQQLNQK